MQANKLMAFDICQKRLIPEKYHVCLFNAGSLINKKGRIDDTAFLNRVGRILFFNYFLGGITNSDKVNTTLFFT